MKSLNMGYILVGIGLFLLILGTVYPLATVIYQTPTLSIYTSFPSGAQDSPTLLKAGSYYTLEAYLTILDVGSLTVKQVNITGAGFEQTVSLTWAHREDYDRIYGSWTAPGLSDGTLLTFQWHVETDKGYKADITSYGKIGGPVGKFYINGQEANIDSVFIVTSPTLQFSFKTTQLGELIVSVYIFVKCDSPYLDQNVPLTETVTDTEWTGNYTLPSRGTYSLLGYISYAGQTHRLMSLISNLGTSEHDFLKEHSLQIVGAVILVVGLVASYTMKVTSTKVRKQR